jgi:hypothetical protein
MGAGGHSTAEVNVGQIASVSRPWVQSVILAFLIVPSGSGALGIEHAVDPGQTLVVDFNLSPADIALVPSPILGLYILVNWAPPGPRGPVTGELRGADGALLESQSYAANPRTGGGFAFLFTDFGSIISDLRGNFSFLNLGDPSLFITDLEFTAITTGAGYGLNATGGTFTVAEPSGASLVMLVLLALAWLPARRLTSGCS